MSLIISEMIQIIFQDDRLDKNSEIILIIFQD